MCGACRTEKPENNPNWKGGTSSHAKGYVVIRVNGKYKFEHTLVMERLLGRLLLKSEQVHHLNGVRCDNRPDNLELWVKSQPSGIRACDALAWARQIVARYEPLEALITSKK